MSFEYPDLNPKNKAICVSARKCCTNKISYRFNYVHPIKVAEFTSSKYRELDVTVARDFKLDWKLSIGNMELKIELLHSTRQNNIKILGSCVMFSRLHFMSLMTLQQFDTNNEFSIRKIIRIDPSQVLNLFKPQNQNEQCFIELEFMIIVPDPEPEILSKLSTDLTELLQRQGRSDVTLTNGVEKYKVHKEILLEKCEAFTETLRDDTDGIKVPKSMDRGTFEAFLYYLYTNEVKDIGDKKCLELLKIAHLYKINDLKLKCEKMAIEKLLVDNVIDFLIQASDCDCKDLKAEAINFVIINENKVTNTVKYEILRKLREDILYEIDKRRSDLQNNECLQYELGQQFV